MNTPNQVATHKHPHDKTALCCHIDCKKKATFHIYTPPWTYDNYTHSCEHHVEDLKSTDNDIVEPIEMWL